MINDVYIIFLMEDGTLEYTGIKNLITNASSEGKIEGISNIQKIFRCARGYIDGGGDEGIIALDNDNNLYDLTYILNK